MAKLDREKPKHDTVMDVTAEQIARVYAKAFMEVAAKSPNVAELVDEIEAVVSDGLNRVPRLEQLLASALVSHEEKEQLLGRVIEHHDALVFVDGDDRVGGGREDRRERRLDLTAVLGTRIGVGGVSVSS